MDRLGALPAWTGWAWMVAWTGWALCRARTNIVPKPRDSVSDAGLSDEYLADPARSRIRLRQGVRRPLGYTRQNARRPVLVLRESSSSAPRSGAFRYGIRAMRTSFFTGDPAAGIPVKKSKSTLPVCAPLLKGGLTPGGEAGRRNRHPARRHTSAFLAFDTSPPAPVTRPLRRRTPVRTLESPVRGRRAGAAEEVHSFIIAFVHELRGGRGRSSLDRSLRLLEGNAGLPCLTQRLSLQHSDCWRS